MVRFMGEITCLIGQERRLQGSISTFCGALFVHLWPHLRRGYSMGLLRLAVLGSPEVFHDSSRLTFALRKAQALLFYLAVEGGMHSRSKLAAFLWPDSEPHDARTGLRNTLTLLRSLLSDDEASPAVQSHLLSPRDLLGLDPQASFQLDLDVVQQAYQQARRISAFLSEPQGSALAAQVQH